MSALRDVLQVTACRIPSGEDSCYIRYRLLEPVDSFLPLLFHDAVTMYSPIQQCSGPGTCLIEACSPGRYQASSFEGSTELEIYLQGDGDKLQEMLAEFDRRIESLGMGIVCHRDSLQTVNG